MGRSKGESIIISCGCPCYPRLYFLVKCICLKVLPFCKVCIKLHTCLKLNALAVNPDLLTKLMTSGKIKYLSILILFLYSCNRIDRQHGAVSRKTEPGKDMQQALQSDPQAALSAVPYNGISVWRRQQPTP